MAGYLVLTKEIVGSTPREGAKYSWLRNIPEEHFRTITAYCKTYTEMCLLLGVGGKNGGPSGAVGWEFKVIKERCRALGITHLDQNRYKRRGECLIPIESHKKRGSFRNRIIRDNLIPYRCSCGNDGTWLGKPLALHLHHKNGKPQDHRLDNVEFLCPNCHSQTESWTGKNMGKTK